jgi:hypothetical protein
MDNNQDIGTVINEYNKAETEYKELNEKILYIYKELAEKVEILKIEYEKYKEMLNKGNKIPIEEFNNYKELKNIFEPAQKMSLDNTITSTSRSTGGGKKTIYKLNGEKVSLLHNNKKIQRCIYVKGKTKYCKINNEFILLSKLKKQ